MSMRSRNSSSAQLAALKRLSARAASTYYTHSHSSFPRYSHTNTTTDRGLSGMAHFGIEELRRCGVAMEEGLSEDHLCRMEGSLNFTFPPDLRAVLHEALPIGVGFVDWRSNTLHQLQLLFTLPSIELTRYHNLVWLARYCSRERWPQASNTDQDALSLARKALNKAPLLIPLFSHYYLPSTPNLAGNPVFFIKGSQVHLASVDLQDFFLKGLFKQQTEPVLRPSRLRKARWIEFWSDLAKRQQLPAYLELSFDKHPSSPAIFNDDDDDSDVDNAEEPSPASFNDYDASAIEQSLASFNDSYNAVSGEPSPLLSPSSFNNSSPHVTGEPSPASFNNSSVDVMGEPSPASFNDIVGEEDNRSTPLWMERFQCRLMDVLREGGWKEEEVSEMMSPNPTPDSKDSLNGLPKRKQLCLDIMDRQSVMEDLALHLNLMSDFLRRGGWSGKDVAEALDVDISLKGNTRKQHDCLPPRLVAQIGKLAQDIAAK